VPLAAYQTHLHTIATHPGVHSHSTKLLFITPPPVNEHQFTDTPLQRTAPHTRLYATACASVATELSIPVVDVWTAFMTRAGWSPTSDADEKNSPLPGSREAPRNEVLEGLLSDGLHLTEEGYRVVLEELEKVIREEVPEMRPENVPMVVPDWKIVMGVE
jgi:isoamyl acetate esterase